MRIAGLCAALLVCAGVQAAGVLIGPPDAAPQISALALCDSCVTALLPDGRTMEVALPAGLEPRVGCWIPDAGYLIFTETTAWVRPPEVTARWSRLRGGPAHVRQAVGPGGNRVLLLHGGVVTPGGLSEAQVDIYELTTGHTLAALGPGIKPEANPRFLAAGELDDGPHALVGVLTIAVFDPHFHLRPWLYSLAGGRLTPAWLGTSFARPYVTAGFGDVDAANAGDELCSLELDADGRRLITAYRRYGFVMEGVAQSAADMLGNTLRTARIRPGEDLVCVWVGGATGRIIGYRMRPSVGDALGLLEPSFATSELARPAAWDVQVTDTGIRAVVLSTDGALRSCPMTQNVANAIAMAPQWAL